VALGDNRSHSPPVDPPLRCTEGKEEGERRGKENSKKRGKKEDANLLFISFLVDMCGFIGGESGARLRHPAGRGATFYTTLSIVSRALPTGAHEARACPLCVLSNPRSAENSTTASSIAVRQ
jgi:hypothetical protein